MNKYRQRLCMYECVCVMHLGIYSICMHDVVFCLHALMWVQDWDICFSASPVSSIASVSVDSFRRSTSRNTQNSPLSSWTASGCPARGWKDLGDFVFPIGPERQDKVVVVNIFLQLTFLCCFMDNICRQLTSLFIPLGSRPVLTPERK